MTNLQSLMTFSELRELSRMPYIKYKEIESILSKPFLDLTIGDLHRMSQTPIFDANFLDLFFTEMLKRYNANQTDAGKSVIE